MLTDLVLDCYSTIITDNNDKRESRLRQHGALAPDQKNKYLNNRHLYNLYALQRRLSRQPSARGLYLISNPLSAPDGVTELKPARCCDTIAYYTLPGTWYPAFIAHFCCKRRLEADRIIYFETISDSDYWRHPPECHSIFHSVCKYQ